MSGCEAVRRSSWWKKHTPKPDSAAPWHRCFWKVDFVGGSHGFIRRRFPFRPRAAWKPACSPAAHSFSNTSSGFWAFSGSSMAVPIHTPRVNNNDDYVRFSHVFVSPGAAVKKGDFIAEIETDKATFTIEAEQDGYVL